MVFSLLTACSGGYHPTYFGNYYVCYRDGKVLVENDSIRQVYLRLNADHTYQITDHNGIENGRWKTKDSDEFYTIYFYTSLMGYLFDDPAGKTMISYLPKAPDAIVFHGPNWYGTGKMVAYSSVQLLFCRQGV